MNYSRKCAEAKFLEENRENIIKLYDLLLECVSTRDKDFLVNLTVEKLEKFCLKSSTNEYNKR